MDKKTYLTELAKELKILSKVEKDEVLADFDEHFQVASEKGRSESDIIQGLGAPRKVAKEILVQYEITKADANPSFNSVSTAVFAAVGIRVCLIYFCVCAVYFSINHSNCVIGICHIIYAIPNPVTHSGWFKIHLCKRAFLDPRTCWCLGLFC